MGELVRAFTKCVVTEQIRTCYDKKDIALRTGIDMEHCYLRQVGLFGDIVTRDLRMLERSTVWLVALHSFQDLEIDIRPRSSKVLPPIDKPLEGTDEQYDAESNDAVV